MKCMDCGVEFKGDAGPPPDRRCATCLGEQMDWFRRLSPERQDEVLADALKKAGEARGCGRGLGRKGER